MANEEQLAILRQGVEVWNEWRKKNYRVKVDLSEAKLSGLNLREIDFGQVCLNGARLNNAYLREATLIDVEMKEVFLKDAYLGYSIIWNANLEGSDLRECIFYGSTLSNVNLKQANMGSANFDNTFLNKVDMSGASLVNTTMRNTSMTDLNIDHAYLKGAVLANNNLRNVQGIETVRHGGPSTIGIDTLIRSDGKIPEIFLRGCGVPENFIEYLPSLIGAMHPIQFYSCFISHSTKDENFAQRLYDRLQGKGIRAWFAPEELKGGRSLDDQIDHAIRLHDKLILVLSDESIRSKWVMKEIRKARREELANNRRKLFPIRLTDIQTLEHWECLDPETGHDLADVVRSYFIPDFSTWKNHDAFERAFGRFLDALKAVDEPPVDGHDNEKRLVYLRRLLTAKKITKAKFGIHVPTHIELEIEDLEREIAQLDKTDAS